MSVRAGNTRLSRRLHRADNSDDARPIEAFRLARRMFLSGEKIDMALLATSIGVDRTTLFRWLGNRDQLLEEIIWSFGSAAWAASLDSAEGSGLERVADVLTRWINDVASAEFFRAYLERESTRALRLLTTREGLHQQRVVDNIERLLIDELGSSQTQRTPLPLASRDMAYVICRIAESFIYSDLITGEQPDAEKAATAIRAVLGVTQVQR